MVRIGGDRAIIGPTNWSAMSHQELYDAICGGNDPGTVFEVSDKWITLGNHMLDSSNMLHQRITDSASGWQGDAAESSRAAITQLVDWGGKASQTAQFMGHQLNQQGQVMATAKANMPKPVPFQLANVSTQPGLSGFNNSLADAQPVQQAADEAHARAIDVANQMEQGSIAIDRATPEFEPVPIVLKRAHTSPALTATDPVRPDQQAEPMAPLEPFQRAQPASPVGQVSPAAAGAPAQPVQPPIQPDRVPAAGSGPVGPGATSPSGVSPATMSPHVQSGPDWSPASVPPPPGAGSPQPVSTTTSGWDGTLQPMNTAPTIPGIGGSPYGGGSGPQQTPWGGGSSWGGPGGAEPGDESFMPGGFGPVAGGGPGGTAGGRGPGGTGKGPGGTGGASEEELPNYRPGSISARLGSGSGLTGARGSGSAAGAAAAAEREAAGAGSGVARGAASSAEEPGMAGSSAARKRKEDDKEHKSAGYVQGEDIFEPLGGELPPPVIGDRRAKRPR